MHVSPHASTSPPPTEDQPMPGTIAVGDVTIAQAEYFVGDDGVHTIRSLEFNVSAHADSLDEAVAMFVVSTEDYCAYLAQLAEAKQAASHELETLGLLAHRVLAVSKDRDDIVTTMLRRLRPKPEPVWLPMTTPTSSKEPSDV
jgi:hypothetical protein